MNRTYDEASHAIQTGVATLMGRGDKRTDPKHLRTGLDLRAADMEGLATLLIEKGVITSYGYGRRRRMTGRIWSFKRQHGSTFGSTRRDSIQRVYGTLDIEIAVISIEIDERPR